MREILNAEHELGQALIAPGSLMLLIGRLFMGVLERMEAGPKTLELKYGQRRCGDVRGA